MEHVLANLLETLRAIEESDPIDFADLPFDEEALREFALRSVLIRHAQLQHDGMSERDLNEMYLLSTAKLVLENLVLNAKLLVAQDKTADLSRLGVEQVLARFRLNPKAD